ncbi:MAG: hypothetical protein [Caudoviricetes sp.]|nr:MAG: hypothetical protein [Caudoviricetes sp.]
MTFPYTGWVLTPGFTPKQEKFVKPYGHGVEQCDWHLTERHKIVHVGSIYSCKAEAICAGNQRLREQQAALDKKQANINKRRAALEKAAGEAKP